MAAAAVSSSSDRLHSLDSLRAVAMLLGIVLHAGLSFMHMPTPWPVHDVYRSIGFDALVGLIHGFRMQVFFFIAGFFGHLLWRREGVRGFLAQRGRRIGIPFAIGMVTIIPLTLWLFYWAASRSGPANPVKLPPPGSIWSFPTMHLWFLEILIFLYLGAALLARCNGLLEGLDLPRRIDTAFDRLIQHPLKPLFLAVPTVGLLWGGPMFGEVEVAGFALLPAGRAVAYYGLFFALGWWLHRRSHLLNSLCRWPKSYLASAALAFLVLGACFDAHLQPSDPAFAAVKTLALAAAAWYSWSMTFAITSLFIRFAARDRPRMRYLADASYWCYLWHLPLVVYLQIAMANWPINGWLKFTLILLVNLLVLLPTYHWLVRYTWAGRILNGPRSRPAALAAQVT